MYSVKSPWKFNKLGELLVRHRASSLPLLSPVHVYRPGDLPLSLSLSFSLHLHRRRCTRLLKRKVDIDSWSLSRRPSKARDKVLSLSLGRRTHSSKLLPRSAGTIFPALAGERHSTCVYLSIRPRKREWARDGKIYDWGGRYCARARVNCLLSAEWADGQV